MKGCNVAGNGLSTVPTRLRGTNEVGEFEQFYSVVYLTYSSILQNVSSVFLGSTDS